MKQKIRQSLPGINGCVNGSQRDFPVKNILLVQMYTIKSAAFNKSTAASVSEDVVN